jgi:hypothetical protein
MIIVIDIAIDIVISIDISIIISIGSTATRPARYWPISARFTLGVSSRGAKYMPLDEEMSTGFLNYILWFVLNHRTVWLKNFRPLPMPEKVAIAR